MYIIAQTSMKKPLSNVLPDEPIIILIGIYVTKLQPFTVIYIYIYSSSDEGKL